MTQPCPQAPSGNHPFKITEPHWRDDRTCSYCGSAHPDDFMAAVEAGKTLTPTDKDYKAYCDGLTNPAQKFYFYHLSEEQMRAFVDLLNANKITFAFPGHFYRKPFFIV